MLLFDDDFDGQETNTEDIDVKSQSSHNGDSHLKSVVANQEIMGKSLSDEDKRKSLKAIYDMREAQMGMMLPDDDDGDDCDDVDELNNDSDGISDSDDPNTINNIKHRHDDSSRDNSITTQSKFDETKIKTIQNTQSNLTQFKSFATQLLLVDDNNTDNRNSNTNMNDSKDTNPVVVVDQEKLLENNTTSKIIVNCISSDADDNNLANVNNSNLDKVQQLEQNNHHHQETDETLGIITKKSQSLNDDEGATAASNFISTKTLILLKKDVTVDEDGNNKIDFKPRDHDESNSNTLGDGHYKSNEQICDDRTCINNFESKDNDSSSKIINIDKNDRITTEYNDDDSELLEYVVIDNEECLDVKKMPPLDYIINETDKTSETDPIQNNVNMNPNDIKEIDKSDRVTPVSVELESVNGDKEKEFDKKEQKEKDKTEDERSSKIDIVGKDSTEKDDKVKYPISLNPFGDDEDDGEEEEKKNTMHQNKPQTK